MGRRARALFDRRFNATTVYSGLIEHLERIASAGTVAGAPASRAQAAGSTR